MRMSEFLNKPFPCDFSSLGGYIEGKFVIIRPCRRGGADFLILICGSSGCYGMAELDSLMSDKFTSVTQKKCVVHCDSSSGPGLNGVRVACVYLVKNSIISINDIKKWHDIENYSFDDLDVPF